MGEKRRAHRHRSTYLACHFLLGKKQNCFVGSLRRDKNDTFPYHSSSQWMAEGLLSHFGYKLWLELHPRSLVSSPVLAAEFTTHRFFFSELAKGEINDDRPCARPLYRPQQQSHCGVRVLGRIKILISAHKPTIVAKFSFIHSERRDNFSSDARSKWEELALTFSLLVSSKRACLSSMYIL